MRKAEEKMKRQAGRQAGGGRGVFAGKARANQNENLPQINVSRFLQNNIHAFKLQIKK